jgi:hypothetical protein
MFPQREFSIKAFEPIFLDSYEFISKHGVRGNISILNLLILTILFNYFA